MKDEMDIAEELVKLVREEGMGPLFSEMPRMTLEDKGIAGPTAAHRIEEVHTPLDLAYITFSTGSSSFQNLIGVTFPEMQARALAGRRMFEQMGIRKGSRVLFCYPPLINLFTPEVFKTLGFTPLFLERPSRDALLAEVIKEQPAAVFGEGSFLAAVIRDAEKLGLLEHFPHGLVLVAAGTPLPEDLPVEVQKLSKAELHDLYGCQEYGVLCLDGIPMRDDLSLLEDKTAEHRGAAPYFHLLVGGLPTGDLFQTGTHRLSSKGRILTYTVRRTEHEPEITVTASTALGRETVVRAAKTIIRLKGHVVRVAKDVDLGVSNTVLLVREAGGGFLTLEGPEKTEYFDSILTAQMEYQKYQKTDPVWNKHGKTYI